MKEIDENELKDVVAGEITSSNIVGYQPGSVGSLKAEGNTVLPDENGNCPVGYKLNGSVCVIIENNRNHIGGIHVEAIV